MAVVNFSWVIPDKLAGSSLPGGHISQREDVIFADLKEMYTQGVRCLISLIVLDKTFGDLCQRAGLYWIQFPMEDFSTPDDHAAFTNLVAQAIDSINADRPVCVHCRMGIGRTGLVLACIVGKYLQLGPAESIRRVRRTRAAIDTDQQERFVYDFLSDNIDQ